MYLLSVDIHWNIPFLTQPLPIYSIFYSLLSSSLAHLSQGILWQWILFERISSKKFKVQIRHTVQPPCLPPSPLNDWVLPNPLNPTYLPTFITQSLLTFLIGYPLTVDPLSEDIHWEIPFLPQSTLTHLLPFPVTPLIITYSFAHSFTHLSLTHWLTWCQLTVDPLLDDILSEIQVSNWPYSKAPHPPSSLNDWSLPYTLHPKYLPTSITQSLLTLLIEYPLQVDPLSEDILWEIPSLPQ